LETRRSNFVVLEGEEVRDKEGVRVLGEDIGVQLYGNKDNFVRVLGQIRGKANRVHWMCRAGGNGNRTVLRTLVGAVIMSRVRAGMVMTVLTEVEYKKVDVVLAGAVKDTLAWGRGVGAREALMVVGIVEAKTELEHEALRIYGRIKAGAAGPLVRDVVKRREEDMEEGEVKGFMPWVRRLLEEEGLMEGWGIDDFDLRYGVKGWKRLVKQTMVARGRRRIEKEWRKVGKKIGGVEMEERG
jgi:hypothetical protein